jgi:ATP-binding cassette subfamily C protein LapB
VNAAADPSAGLGPAGPEAPLPDGADSNGGPLLAVLVDRAARLVGQRAAAGALADVQALRPESAPGPAAAFARAWQVARLEGEPAVLPAPTPADLPFVGHAPGHGWLLVTAVGHDGAWRARTLQAEDCSLPAGAPLLALGLPRRSGTAAARPRAGPLLWRAMWARKGAFVDAVLGTALVSVLTLATSLYSMQVFDRVIPNQGFDTLWVLTVGVGLAVLLELVLKIVRARMVDRAANEIDHELSQWFFARMLGIRMEARPPSVGTLASQVKGFEMVRGVLASTSLFVLADVPFALLFVAVIALVGGWVALVPVVFLPLALVVGLMFQGAVQRHTRLNLSASNRKAGLLVEAVDGAEALKAQGGEWAVQGRWSRLVDEAGDADQRVRDLTALSQNLTMALQQFGYVAIMAVGAWLVATNRMSSGALLACSIVGSRAMAPVVQLPGVMVQWALARAALDGLQQVVSLPNEADDAHAALAPQSLQAGLLFERIRFAYGRAAHPALEVERLVIGPGERVGLIGPIGSGKSTLLKLASGLYRPAQGRVFLGGVDLATLAPAVARELVGYLPQEARLFSGTLRDNLLLGLPDPGDDAILAAARRTGLIELVLGQPAGLALEITEGGRGVSGGQKQLIALTRLLLARPRVWLLDEPTGSMDSATEARVVQLLRELAQEGVTLIVTTHKTALLPLLDRLLVLTGGRVSLDGPRDPVLARVSGKAPAAVAPVAAAAPGGQG